MVQFVFTPWRNRAELLKVRSQFYPPAALTSTSTSTTAYSPADLQAIQKAIARVFMWVHRGHCPHVVESTAMLMSAVVLDGKHHSHHSHHQDGKNEGEGGNGEEEEDDDDDDDDAASDYVVRAAYLTAFTRFVTGLLDGHQDKARKLSMYGVARTVGLPAGFVELRHQGTHEAMPGLARLRPAAVRALHWIWEYYWKNLPEDEEEEDDHDHDEVGENEKEKEKQQQQQQQQPRRQRRRVVPTPAAVAVTAAGGTGGQSPAGATSGIRERMCKRALMGYLQRQEGEVGDEAAKEALMRQISQWEDRLVVGVLADIGESARDSGMLARSVRLSRDILGRAPGEGVQDAPDMAGDIEGLREELSRARRELEGTEAGGKRKRDGNDDDGPGWKRWEEPWTPRPIGIL